MITVKVCEAGGVFNTFQVEEDSTVGHVLEKSGANINVQKQILIDQKKVTMDDIVKDGDILFISPNIKGNI